MDLDRGGDRGLKHRHHRLDPVDRFDDVGAGLALDCQNDRAAACCTSPRSDHSPAALMARPISRIRTGAPLR